MIYKWDLLLKVKGSSMGFFRTAWIFFVSTFVGVFLPTTVGTDAARAFNSARYVSDSTEAASSVAVDRFLGIAALLIMVLGSIVFSQGLLANTNILTTALALITILITAVWLFNRKELLRKIGGRFGFFEDNVLTKWFKGLYSSLYRYKNHKQTILLAFGLSLMTVVLRVLMVYFLSLSLRLAIPMYHCFIFVPSILLFARLPITISGIGVRESAFVYFFSYIGIAAYSALAVSLLYYFLGLIAVLPGGVIYAITGMPRQKERVEAA